MRRYFQSLKSNLSNRIDPSFSLASCSTVSTLSAIYQNLKTFDRNKIEGSLLDVDEIMKIIKNLKNLEVCEMLKHPCIKNRYPLLLNGIEILEVKGWDYAALVNTYEYAAKLARTVHIPVVVHVTELTQPLGHSTSGSHQRYKSKARLEWEKEYDCNVQFRNWILAQGIATEEEVEALEKTINTEVREAKTTAWAAVNKPINEAKAQLHQVLHKVLAASNNNVQVRQALMQLDALSTCNYRELLQLARTVLPAIASTPACTPLKEWYNATKTVLSPRFSDELYTQEFSTLTRDDIPPTYPNQVEKVDGRVLLRDNFEALFSAHDNLIVFGEDVGTIGDVNQGLEGLQEKFGPARIADTGIREATIFGQGMGMALRGLRPIAEIQYLDYILYCLQGLSDDLASLSYRTKENKFAP